MTIFSIIFLTKYSLKRTKLQNFKEFSRGTVPRTPLANAWLRVMQIPPTFPEKF